MNKKNIALAIVFLAFFIAPSVVQAEEAISIQLRIEGPTNTFLNAIVLVPDTCSVVDTTTTTPHDFSGYKAICALQAVQEQGLLTYQATDWGWGFSLDKINETANAADWSQLWILRINNAASQTGIDGLVLNQGDNLLISYGPWPMEPLQIISSTSTLEVNAQLVLQTKVWDDIANSFIDFTDKSVFWIDDKSYESSSGTLLWTADVEGSKQIRVEADGKTRSGSQTINVMPAPTATTPVVSLHLRHQDITFFEGSVTSTQPLFATDTLGVAHPLSASSSVLTSLLDADALSDSFSVSKLDYYDSYNSFYLDCLTITSPTSTVACGNWNYVVDGAYPSVGMDSYALKGGEQVYVYYGSPWQITASTSTFPINTTTTLSTWRYNYNSTSTEWVEDGNDTVDISVPNPAPAGWWDATITTTTLTTNASGAVEHVFSATGTYYAKITSSNYSKWSPAITLTVTEAPSSAASSTPEEQNNNNNGGGGGGGGVTFSAVPSNVIEEKVLTILNFLISRQDADGKIINAGTTDWAIMSFGAHNQYASDISHTSSSLRDFIKNNASLDNEANVCAAYARRVLALRAAGVLADDAAVASLVSFLTAHCGAQGDKNLPEINDDIFTALALKSVGEDTGSFLIKGLRDAIVGAQDPASGAFMAWGSASPDMTGAALNALKMISDDASNGEVMVRAEQYLRASQKTDGGWNGWGETADAVTTAWVMMGINALGQGQSQWITAGGKTPWHALTEKLTMSGYYESPWDAEGIDWFGAKHAAPALLGKTWPIILLPKPPSVAEPASQQSGASGGVGGSVGSFIINEPAVSSTSSATSTLPAVSLFSDESPTSTIIMSAPVENMIQDQTSPKKASVRVQPAARPRRRFSVQSVAAATPLTVASDESIPAGDETIAPASHSSVPEDPFLPIKKKAAAGAVTGSAMAFAGASFLLIIRLLLAAL